MKKILILTTGGTIAGEETPHGLIPSLDSEQLLSFVPEVGDNIHLDTIDVCNLDSTDMTYKEWLDIAGVIRKNYVEYDGFVVAHGTDTMAYTAAALSYLIQNSPKPIVLTGAQKPIGSEITDAKSNLRDSIIYAADDNSSDVVVVFDGAVIAGTRARKNKTHSFSAFSSINYPEPARIIDGRIIRYIPGRTPGKPVFYDDLNPKVFLMKLTPGQRPGVLRDIIDTHDAVIIESFGVGGLPNSLADEFASIMKEYNSNEKVVIMTTQVAYEGSDIGVYEVGQRISRQIPILEARDMTTEAVLTKIMWIMKQDLSFEEIKRLFYSEINHDTIY